MGEVGVLAAPWSIHLIIFATHPIVWVVPTASLPISVNIVPLGLPRSVFLCLLLPVNVCGLFWKVGFTLFIDALTNILQFFIFAISETLGRFLIFQTGVVGRHEIHLCRSQ